jgi:hypothetical protein
MTSIVKWLTHADVIIGFHLIFDLSWLRASRQEWRDVLYPGSHQLIDASLLANLHYEKREERGLEPLACLMLGVAPWKPSYEEKLPADHPKRILHNATDSHITAALAVELAKRLTDRSH